MTPSMGCESTSIFSTPSVSSTETLWQFPVQYSSSMASPSAVHYAGGMRTPLRGPLCNGRPSGLAGARHIALATGSWRPSHRITSRTGPLRRHRRRDCNGAEPAGRAGEPPRGSPRVARAPTCTRLGRQRIIHRLRARAVPPHPQPRCGVRSHGGRLHRRLRGAALVPNDDIADSRRIMDTYKQHDRAAHARAAGARLFGNHRPRRSCPLFAHTAVVSVSRQNTHVS